MNDQLWVGSYRFRLADRAAVPRTAQAIHSADGQWLTHFVQLNRQNPIKALQPSLPEAPFWASVFERQAESVRGIESELRSWGTVSTPYPANSGRISLMY